MARITVWFTVSLLPDMFDELEEVRAVHHRTRSKLFREALRRYLAAVPQYLGGEGVVAARQIPAPCAKSRSGVYNSDVYP